MFFSWQVTNASVKKNTFSFLNTEKSQPSFHLLRHLYTHPNPPPPTPLSPLPVHPLPVHPAAVRSDIQAGDTLSALTHTSTTSAWIAFIYFWHLGETLIFLPLPSQPSYKVVAFPPVQPRATCIYLRLTAKRLSQITGFIDHTVSSNIPRPRARLKPEPSAQL